MAVRRITKAAVKGLPPGGILWDSDLSGFGVRRVKRQAVYCLKYRFNNRARWYAIGPDGSPWTPDLARREALRLLTLIRVERRDPAAERDTARREQTFAEFAQRFLDEHAARKVKPATLAEYTRQIGVVFNPRWGHLRVSTIARADIEKLHKARRDTPTNANRFLATLSVMFGVAEKWAIIPPGSNPSRHIQRYRENRRERLLTVAELTRLGDALARAERGWTDEEWEAIPKKERPTRRTPEDKRALDCIRLLALTGARKTEVLTLRWDALDLKRGVARLADSKVGARNVVLSPPAVAILKAQTVVKNNPYCFPGDREGGHFVGLPHAWERVRALAGLGEVRLHDLRHAFASTAASAGESLYVVGKLLGHRVPATTARYAHLSPDPVKAAGDRTAETIADALAGAPA